MGVVAWYDSRTGRWVARRMYYGRPPSGLHALTDSFERRILNRMVQYVRSFDDVFTALADPTRRGILELLGDGDASISDLAARFEMTLTGVTKHVQLLEAAGLVRSTKSGRVRKCSLGARPLDDELDWITRHRRQVAARLDHLGVFLETTTGDD